MAYDSGKIIEVATKIKAAQDELARLEAELRKLVLSQSPLVNLAASIGVPSRVVGLLNADPSRDFSAEDVWKKLGIKESYARPLLSRLVSDGKIEKRGRGAYGAVGGNKQKSLESVRTLGPYNDSGAGKRAGRLSIQPGEGASPSSSTPRFLGLLSVSALSKSWSGRKGGGTMRFTPYGDPVGRPHGRPDLDIAPVLPSSICFRRRGHFL